MKPKVLLIDTQAAQNVDRLACFAAKITQRPLSGESIEEVTKLFYKPPSQKTIRNLIKAEHRNVFSLNMIPVVIVGASRRFLAQITRHQVGVSFMSTSLQYSAWENPTFYGDEVPEVKERYEKMMHAYLATLEEFGSDLAGYFAPEGLQGTIIISATPWEWRHIIQVRTCERNTPETVEIVSMIRDILKEYSIVFDTGPGCEQESGCKEVMKCRREQPQFVSMKMSKE